MSGEKSIKKKINSKNRHTDGKLPKEILKSLGEVFWQYDLINSKWIYLYPLRESVTGYSVRQMCEEKLSNTGDIIHPDDSSKIRDLFEQIQSGFFPYDEKNIEYRFKHKTGQWIWLRDTIKVIRDEDGNAASLAGTTKEIGQVKNLQSQLSESERKYRQLYEYAHIALYRTRIEDGRFLACNEKFVRILRFHSKEECLKHYSTELYNCPRRRSELIELLLKKKEVFDFEIEGERFDKTFIWMKISARIYPEQGYIEGTLVDVTALKILTEIELAVLGLVLKGMSSRQIADQLHRSVRTIEDHRARIMRKLAANNLVELTRRAIELGINGFAE